MLKFQLRTVSEITRYSEETWGHGFENDEQAYEDAMLTGEYHEERTGLEGLAERLSEEDIVRLFVPIAQALVAGSVSNRADDEGIQVIMRCHDLLVKWSRRHLNSISELLDALVDVRNLVIKELAENRFHSWHQTIDQMHLVETGVYYHTGMHRMALDAAYGTAIHKMES